MNTSFFQLLQPPAFIIEHVCFSLICSGNHAHELSSNQFGRRTSGQGARRRDAHSFLAYHPKASSPSSIFAGGELYSMSFRESSPSSCRGCVRKCADLKRRAAGVVEGITSGVQVVFSFCYSCILASLSKCLPFSCLEGNFHLLLASPCLASLSKLSFLSRPCDYSPPRNPLKYPLTAFILDLSIHSLPAIAI